MCTFANFFTPSCPRNSQTPNPTIFSRLKNMSFTALRCVAPDSTLDAGPPSQSAGKAIPTWGSPKPRSLPRCICRRYPSPCESSRRSCTVARRGHPSVQLRGTRPASPAAQTHASPGCRSPDPCCDPSPPVGWLAHLAPPRARKHDFANRSRTAALSSQAVEYAVEHVRAPARQHIRHSAQFKPAMAAPQRLPPPFLPKVFSIRRLLFWRDFRAGKERSPQLTVVIGCGQFRSLYVLLGSSSRACSAIRHL
jgi:hypothetical protein